LPPRSAFPTKGLAIWASMERRTFLSVGAGAASFVLAGRSTCAAPESEQRQPVAGLRFADLNPDRMWPVYRRYHLLIVGQRDDERGSALTAAVVDVLLRFLPNSRALLVRAADARRVGVLIATEQQDVAIMAAESAEKLFLGKPPFEDIPNAPLRGIVSFGSHVLVCRPSFKAQHAYLIARTLAGHQEALPAPATVPQGIVPAHPGSQAFFAGEGIPND
jgi:hypothetical protein